MSTETSETQVPQQTAAPASDKTEAQAVNPDGSHEGDDEGQDTTEESATSDGKDAPAKPNKGPRKRIDELTWQKHEALRERDAERRQREELQRKLESLQPKYDSGTGPTLADFNWDEPAYAQARDEWVRNQAVTELQQRQEREAQERQKTERLTTFAEKVQAFEVEQPGGWQAASTAPINYTEAMQEAILTSDIGPKIAFHLSQHLDEADEISRMTPYATAVAMARLETKLSASAAPVQPPKPVTKAPAPPVRLSPGAPIKTEWSQMSPEQHRAALRAKQQARG